MKKSRVSLAVMLAATGLALGQLAIAKDAPLSGLKLRNIGAAHTGGRISDLATVPGKPSHYYVGVAAGGVWKTENAGTTFTPIFDRYGSYAVGVVELDPKDPQVIWVGTGENNSQRSVASGDGVYKSVDGGKTFENVGLKNSGHISQIIVDPRDSNTVFVAAQGPLWSSGGDRGLYKTSDGGKTWTRILEIDKHTGINEVLVNKDNPDEMIASSYQRRRHVWTLINGGPGSGLHKTTDGGKTWKKLTQGLPASEKGRIGLAAAPSQAKTVYAIIEANDKDKGIYRSDDFGKTWTKRSSYMSSSPQYYNELVVGPKNPDRLFVMDTFTKVSMDGGKTFKPLSFKARHVDDHALWVNPEHSNHLRIGGDGGIYESFDNGAHWNHLRNLPLTQFYRIAADNDKPFYNVYGGTQDNNTLGTAVRNTSMEGITNADWWVTLGGDGFEPAIDPNNPDIVYSQYQYGGLARSDRKTREAVYITPQPAEGEDSLRWNWNAPLLISPHKGERLYYGAEKLFRSDDRGDSWVAVSGDLSRDLDRNKLKVMDRVWSVDAIAKNDSTSVYGSLIALDESTLQEGLLAVGTDDGLVQVSDNGGQSWVRYDRFKGVPDMSLVEDLQFSVHSKDVLYAVFDNHKRGDEKPYVLKSTNRGKSWKSIAGDLPVRGTVHTIVEDHIDPNLLFVGTEYGAFYSQDGGERWNKFSQLPTIAVRDLEIQRRENDLLLGTFGRGIYVLDDYSPLRTNTASLKGSAATVFPVKDSPIYMETRRWGGYSSDKGMMGDNFFIAPNPEYGVTLRYYLRDGLHTLKAKRHKQEAKLQKDGKDTPYPSWDDLHKEANQEAPSMWFEIKDANNNIVRKVAAKTAKGLQQVNWDFRYESIKPVSLKKAQASPWGSSPQAPLALPGKYSAQLMQRVDGKVSPVAKAQSFSLNTMNDVVLQAEDRQALLAFQKDTAKVQAQLLVVGRQFADVNSRLQHILKAIDLATTDSSSLDAAARELRAQLQGMSVELYGDSVKRSANEVAPWGIMSRVNAVIGSHWHTQAAAGGNVRSGLEIAKRQLSAFVPKLEKAQQALAQLEEQADRLGLPWTPGRPVQ